MHRNFTSWQPGVTRQIGKKIEREKQTNKQKIHTSCKNLGGQETVTSLDADHPNEEEEDKQRNMDRTDRGMSTPTRSFKESSWRQAATAAVLRCCTSSLLENE